MHVCKIVSPINSNNNYYITFFYLDISSNVIQSEVDINNIVNYIRLNYKINNIPYVVEYDNIEYEIIKSDQTTITYKLLLTKLNYKLKLLPPNTDCEITVFFKKDIDDPSLMISK
jgi:hypothetical protein